MTRTVAFTLLGTTLDTGRGPDRWQRWRPTVALCQQEDLALDRLEILYPLHATSLARQIAADVEQVSPQTKASLHLVNLQDPWDFEEVYTALHDFAAAYAFDTEAENYLVHITTGTHVAQICLFLLTETRRFPARLIQTSPKQRSEDSVGEYRLIDLDLSRYDSIAARKRIEFSDNIAGLKSGIATRNAAFNKLIEEVEHVAAHSAEPILLMGPTGAGKSQLARRIYELKKHRRQIESAAPFVDVNCATLRGDAAMSTLFGHRKGAFTGAMADRPGLLKAAHGGLLFLDEIGELGLDEQAMLLRALEEKRFLPLGADKEASSDFQLIAGTNRNLPRRVEDGLFREDLLARINLWTFCLPALRERVEDIEPNLEYELSEFSRRTGRTVRFSKEARDTYLKFAIAPDAQWAGNFRDLSASVTRMATLAANGRITEDVVAAETRRLRAAWDALSSKKVQAAAGEDDPCARAMGHDRASELDAFDRVQLARVLEVCAATDSLSEAGRELFAASRLKKRSSNDADRLRKYLGRFGLTWDAVRAK